MSRLRQLVGLADVLLQPGGAHAFLKWKPFSITSFRMLRILRKKGLEFSTIIDGGANKGQFARAATEVYPEADIISFEPLPDVARRLRENLKDRSQVTVHELALGARDDTIQFFRQAYTLASSALRPASEAEAGDVLSIDVRAARLDTVLDGITLRRPSLLKLDLQGYELEALHGAPRTLQTIDYVLMEMSFSEGYEGEPGFVEVLDFMRDAGFIFIGPIDALIQADGEVIQMDGLFRAKTTPVE